VITTWLGTLLDPGVLRFVIERLIEE